MSVGERYSSASVAGSSFELKHEPNAQEVEMLRREELRKQQDKRDQLELERLQALKRQSQDAQKAANG